MLFKSAFPFINALLQSRKVNLNVKVMYCVNFEKNELKPVFENQILLRFSSQ